MIARMLLGSMLLLASGCSGCGQASPAGAGQQVAGQPVETREPNAEAQKPAVASQTRAAFASTGVEIDVRRVVKGLEHPWGLAFLPDGGRLVTERPGRMRIVSKTGELSEPVTGLPKVMAEGQGGLLDVVLGPTFATDGTIFFSFAEERAKGGKEPGSGGGNGTAVARAKLLRDGKARLESVQVIWRQTPALDSNNHFGSRIVVAKDGNLFITTGERSITEGRMQAQRMDGALGKIIRVTPDGKAPADNPFVGTAGALPEIFSIGHRNIQGAALHPQTGELWVADHGARGGDEVNVVRKGKDYGWPTITYGIEYSGGKIGEGFTEKAGMEQPIYYWDPSIAPSGFAFYDADLFPGWKGSVLVGALAGKHISRLTLKGDAVVGEERILADRARVRDVRVGPEGAVYVLTDEADGELLALFPKK